MTTEVLVGALLSILSLLPLMTTVAMHTDR